MKTGTFMDIISIHYQDIRKSFSSRSIGGILDEDSFNDAFIRCATHFGNEIIDYDTAAKYFFTAYKNTHIKNEQNSSRHSTDEIDINVHDYSEDDDTLYAKEVFDEVMDAISKEFSKEDMNIFRLYRYDNWTIGELIDTGYDCDEFDERIRDIDKFVKKYCKTHFKSGR